MGFLRMLFNPHPYEVLLGQCKKGQISALEAIGELAKLPVIDHSSVRRSKAEYDTPIFIANFFKDTLHDPPQESDPIFNDHIVSHALQQIEGINYFQKNVAMTSLLSIENKAYMLREEYAISTGAPSFQKRTHEDQFIAAVMRGWRNRIVGNNFLTLSRDMVKIAEIYSQKVLQSLKEIDHFEALKSITEISRLPMEEGEKHEVQLQALEIAVDSYDRELEHLGRNIDVEEMAKICRQIGSDPSLLVKIRDQILMQCSTFSIEDDPSHAFLKMRGEKLKKRLRRIPGCIDALESDEVINITYEHPLLRSSREHSLH